MKRIALITVLLLAATPLLAVAADDCCPPSADGAQLAQADAGTPTSQPDAVKLPAGHPPVGRQLPPGHPPMGGMGGGKMPAGHPPIGGMGGNLPEGHPNIGGMGGQLPAGHPQMGTGGKPGPLEVPTTQAESVTGTVMVQVIQGSRGGAAVEGLPVTLDMSYYGKTWRTYEGKANASGRVVFNDVPVGVALDPKVTVPMDGLEFYGRGETMGPKKPDQAIRVTVYETTEQQPPLRIIMHHAIVKPLADGTGYGVQERMTIASESDRVWIGRPVGEDGKRVTLDLAVPSTVAERDQPAKDQPVYPGQSSLLLNYAIPLRDGKAELILTTMAATESLAVIKVDEPSVAVEPVNMEKGEQMRLQQSGVMTFYVAKNLKPGDKAGIRITSSRKAASGKTSGGAWTSQND